MNIPKNIREGIIEYRDSQANLPVNGNPLDTDNFYPADGGVAGADDEFYSEIFGLSKAERDQRQARKNLKTESKAKARVAKADAKLGGAEAQKEAAKSLGKDTTAGDVALAKALGGDKKVKEDKMSPLLIGGIVVGGLALVIGGIILIKKMKKK